MRLNSLLFVHIPKTAGISLDDQLKNAFGQAASIRFGDSSSIQRFRGLRGYRLRRYRYITGHIPLKEFREKGIAYPAISVVRSPVERLLSMYRYLNQSTHPDHTELKFRDVVHFTDYVRSQPHFINSQCEYIGGGKTASEAIGTLTRETIYVVPLPFFGDMLQVLSRLLPRPIESVHLNRSGESSDPPDLVQRARVELERFSEEDTKLYEAITKGYADLKHAFLEKLARSEHVTKQHRVDDLRPAAGALFESRWRRILAVLRRGLRP
jgi:hypothetical protein